MQVEQLPSFKGGLDAFYKYAQSNLIYPEEAKKNKIDEKVYVEFIVSKSGKIEAIKILRRIGYGCDEAAIELINNSPNWIPGKQRGKVVKVKMVLPVTFKLS